MSTPYYSKFETEEKLLNVVVGSTPIGDPTDTLPSTGNIHSIGAGAGTYANWGGMVIPENNIGTLRRINGEYFVSLTEIDLGGYLQESDIINSVTSTATDKPASANSVRVLGLSKANLEVGKNLFNWEDADIVVGSVIGTDGNLYSGNSGFIVTGYIPVTVGQSIVCNYGSAGFFSNYYDDNKVKISTTLSTGVLIIPSGAFFVRKTVYHTVLQEIQIEIGTVSTFVELYKKSVPLKELGNATLKSDFKLLKLDVDSRMKKALSKNLFNKDSTDNIIGFLDNSGNITSYSEYTISHYIPVTPSTAYYNSNTGVGGAFHCYYDIDKNFISSFNTEASTVPSNAYYVRLSISVSYSPLTQFELGSSATFYKAYTELAFLEPTSLSIVNKLDKEVGKNLIDKNSPDIQTGKFYGPSGELNTNSLYNATGLIPVKPSTTYIHSNLGLGGAACVIYNIDGAVVDSFNGSDPSAFTTPSNAYFVKLSIQASLMDVSQLEEGSVATVFSPYTEYAKLGLAEEKLPIRQLSIILPKKLYFVKNHQVSIYYENIILQQLKGNATVFFDKGINHNRLASFYFTSVGTNQVLNSLLINNLRKLESKNITYDVIDPASNNGKTVNALFIGDSFTDIGTYVKEVKRLLELQGVTFNLIGTCGNSTYKAEGLSGGQLINTFLNNSSGVARIVNVTGITVMPTTTYPGTNYIDSNGNIWTPRGGKIDGSGNGKLIVTKFGAVNGDFTTFPSSGILTKTSSSDFEGDTAISYNTPVSAYFNPFMNHSTGVLDLTNYITYWGFATPNVIVFQFTWNDLGLWATDTEVAALVANFKVACDHVHTSYPSAKVVLSIEPFGSINGNQDYNGKKFSVLRLVELMLIQFEDDSAYNNWVKIAPSYAYVDLVNGYGGGDIVIPSSRYPSVSEESGGDGVHPNPGMLEIGDCLADVVSASI